MDNWNIFICIYMGIGFIQGLYILKLLNPTDEQLKKLQEDKTFWDACGKELEEVWEMVRMMPQLTPLIIFIVILFWPPVMIGATLGEIDV